MGLMNSLHSGDLGIFLRQQMAERMPRMGNLRWFIPTEVFWEVMHQWRSKAFIECGCGNGALTREAVKQDFRFVGIDLVERDGQHEQVLHMDAVNLTFNKHLWAIVCRPDHSGWAYATIQNALKRGASAIYVGLPDNFERDLDDLLDHVTAQFTSVGTEGESLLYFDRGKK